MGRQNHTEVVERFTSTACFLKKRFPHWKLGASYQGWQKALLAENESLFEFIKNRLRQARTEFSQDSPLQKTGKACSRTGPGRWRLFAVDGSKVEGPRTRANQAASSGLGKHNGMPQFSLTVLFDLERNLPWDFRVDTDAVGERTHLRNMLESLPAESLLVADAGFVGYSLCCELIERKIPFLLRAGGNVHLLEQPGIAVQEQGSGVFLWPKWQQQYHQPALCLRLIRLENRAKRRFIC